MTQHINYGRIVPQTPLQQAQRAFGEAHAHAMKAARDSGLRSAVTVRKEAECRLALIELLELVVLDVDKEGTLKALAECRDALREQLKKGTL